MEFILAQPRSLCAGVVRAIDIVELALQTFPGPIYVYHDIVHNGHVVRSLKEQGVIFVENIEDIPLQSVAIFSAHGVSQKVVEQAKQRQLNIIDATCPLVAKVHLQCQRFAELGYTVIVVGHMGHQEIEGTLGSFTGPRHVISRAEQVDALPLRDSDKVAYVTQTTLSIDDTRSIITALKNRFPTIQGPGLSDICYATQNRQLAIKALVGKIDLLLVVGARNSSNCNSLKQLGKQLGFASYLIEDSTELQRQWLHPDIKVGITAGASAPESLVDGVVDKLSKMGATSIKTHQGSVEHTTFTMPQNLLDAAKARQ